MKANKTLIKSIASVLCLGCLALQLSAQVRDDIKPSTLAFHVSYYDFKTGASLSNVFNGMWSSVTDMQMGIGFNYLQGITKNIDIVGTLDGSYTNYLYSDGTTNGSSQFLLDANAVLNIKLFTDRHTIVPYLLGGVGTSIYKGKVGLYTPLGMGLQINLFNQVFIFPKIEYRSLLSSAVNSHLQYSIGIGTSITKKKKVKVIPPVLVETTIIELVKITPPPAEVKIPVKDFLVKVTDNATSLPLQNVTVVIDGPDGKISTVTNANGEAVFKALKAANYAVSGTLNGISTSTLQISKTSFDIPGEQMTIDISHNDPRFTLVINVHDNSTHHTGGGIMVDVTNNTQNNSVTGISQLNDSTYSVQLIATCDFTVSGKKAGYISNIEKVSTKGLNRSTALYVNLILAIESALPNKTISLKNIYYDNGSSAIRAGASSDLEKLVKFLRDNPNIIIQIASHTDSRGSKSANLKLSLARAQQVVNYLQKNGIAKNRLISKGYGATKLVNGCTVGIKCTEAQHEQNRRTEFKVVGNRVN
jgi:outer membrane protein OmpA-like peptidoglycan-associated protein